MNGNGTEYFNSKLIFVPSKPWYAGTIYKIDIGTRTDADAVSSTEETWCADTGTWAGPDADVDAESITVVPMSERVLDSSSNDTTPISCSESPCS